MGHIMEEWDDDWNIPTIDTEKLEKQNLEVQDVDDDEEEGEEQEK
jgi:hypothetical protein